MKVKRQRLYLSRIRDSNGLWITDQEEIVNEAKHAYKSQLNGDPRDYEDGLFEHIPLGIHSEQAAELEAFPSQTELHDIVISLSKYSTSVPDGYNGQFYQTCWYIIKDDLYEAILEFFAGHHLPRVWTSTLIIPVPRVASPETFKDLRPISLCNFCSKVISKLLSVRLAKVLPNIFSPHQGSFVQGRSILDNILLTQEMIQSIKNNV